MTMWEGSFSEGNATAAQPHDTHGLGNDLGHVYYTNINYLIVYVATSLSIKWSFAVRTFPSLVPPFPVLAA